MPSSRGTWAAVWCGFDRSDPLWKLRKLCGDTADLYFYRAILWCKEQRPSGELAGEWDRLAEAVRYPGTGDELASLWRDLGLVEPMRRDLLYLWDQFNGWIIRKQLADTKRAARNRAAKVRAGKASVKRRRELARVRAQ